MPAESVQLLSTFEVSMNGAPLSDVKRESLLDAIVEQSSELPDSCILRFGVSLFQDSGEELLATDAFPEGAVLVVKVKTLESASGEQLFEGEIVGNELDLTSLGPSTLTVKALHHAHRLMRGTRQRNFLNKKDSDIFSEVVGGASLSPQAASTTIVYPYTLQDNLTDWDFLKSLARRSNARIGCGPNKKVVLDTFKGQANSITVKWAEDLINFRPRSHGAGQVSEVEVRGWDYKTKKEVVGSNKDSTTGVPNVGVTVAKGKQSFPNVKHVLSNQPVSSAQQAQHLAESVMRQLRGRFLQMEALCVGNPSLAPGKMLQVENVGSRFNGSYPITATSHIFSPSEGYTTQVFSLGRDSEGLLPGLEGGGETGSGMGSGGLVVAIVTNIEDPEKLGRVKVMYPTLQADQESFWCRLVNPMAGNGRGFMVVPEVNDEVLVGFEQGDPHYPFVLGALWNGKDLPPDDMGKALNGGQVMRRVYKSRIGHTLLFDDSPDNQQIQVISKNGHYVKLDDKNRKIEIFDSSGQNKITIDTSANSISVDAVKDITLTAGGNITLDAKGKVVVKGIAGVEATSPAPVKVESSSQLDLKSNGMLNAEAMGIANIKSTAVLNIQGSLVKIN